MAVTVPAAGVATTVAVVVVLGAALAAEAASVAEELPPAEAAPAAHWGGTWAAAPERGAPAWEQRQAATWTAAIVHALVLIEDCFKGIGERKETYCRSRRCCSRSGWPGSGWR
jgi:hypothetical protein